VGVRATAVRYAAEWCSGLVLSLARAHAEGEPPPVAGDVAGFADRSRLRAGYDERCGDRLGALLADVLAAVVGIRVAVT
jgi:hypothetical protein